MKKLCKASEGCKNKVDFTLIDHNSKKRVSFCKAHFESGMKAWLEPDPIIKLLMQKGII